MSTGLHLRKLQSPRPEVGWSAAWQIRELPGILIYRRHPNSGWEFTTHGELWALLNTFDPSFETPWGRKQLLGRTPSYDELIRRAKRAATGDFLAPAADLFPGGEREDAYRQAYEIWLALEDQRFPTRREALQVLGAMMELHSGEPEERA